MKLPAPGESPMKSNLQKIAEAAVLAFDDGRTTVSSYSGRGMFGKECVGVSCDSASKFSADVAEYLLDNPDTEGAHEVLQLLRKGRTDTLGKGQIFYFPSVPYVREE